MVPVGQLYPTGDGFDPLRYGRCISWSGFELQPKPWSQLHAGMGLTRLAQRGVSPGTGISLGWPGSHQVEPAGKVPSETSFAGIWNSGRPSEYRMV